MAARQEEDDAEDEAARKWILLTGGLGGATVRLIVWGIRRLAGHGGQGN